MDTTNVCRSCLAWQIPGIPQHMTILCLPPAMPSNRPAKMASYEKPLGSRNHATSTVMEPPPAQLSGRNTPSATSSSLATESPTDLVRIGCPDWPETELRIGDVAPADMLFSCWRKVTGCPNHHVGKKTAPNHPRTSRCRVFITTIPGNFTTCTAYPSWKEVEVASIHLPVKEGCRAPLRVQGIFPLKLDRIESSATYGLPKSLGT